MVYIYGGGFSSGSGSVPVYDGEEMAKKGVVFITINYRVGIFGFFSHPELTAESPYHSSGNYGLLDQVEALKWIQENISSFGGDPANVTIAGQSAGAFSVNYLVASPLAGGLFHRAIAESGGAVLSMNRLAGRTGLEEAEQAGVELAERLGVSSVSDLRQLDADSLLRVRAMTGPIIDGYALPEPMFDIFSSGRQNDVPVLTGWNAREGNFGGPPQVAEAFRDQAVARYGDRAEEFLSLFPADNDSVARESQTVLSGLQTFGIQAFAWANMQHETGSSKVYMYHFTRSVPFGEGQQDWGAFHTGEVPYAYKNLRMSDIRPWEDIDYTLEEVMSSYWVNFAANGDPNGEGLPEWLPCEPDEYRTMYLGDTQELRQIPDLKRLEFLLEFHTSGMEPE
jgi:para-nitrobenzyl esterase